MSLALVCTNVVLGIEHHSLAVAEPSPAGGWRATCKCCDHQWTLTPRQVAELGLAAAPAAMECEQ